MEAREDEAAVPEQVIADATGVIDLIYVRTPYRLNGQPYHGRRRYGRGMEVLFRDGEAGPLDAAKAEIIRSREGGTIIRRQAVLIENVRPFAPPPAEAPLVNEMQDVAAPGPAESAKPPDPPAGEVIATPWGPIEKAILVAEIAAQQVPEDFDFNFNQARRKMKAAGFHYDQITEDTSPKKDEIRPLYFYFMRRMAGQ